MLHSVCHSNHQQLTEAQVVKMLADICDRNDDGIIKEAEVVVGFAEVLGTSRECFWFFPLHCFVTVFAVS